MQKTTVLWGALKSLFLVIFNAFFFLLGGADHPASVWASYAFIHLAYLLLIATPYLTRESKSAHLFGVVIASISASYFLLEFFVGLLFILVAPESPKFAIFVQLIIAGAYAAVLIANMLANEHTADAEEKRQVEIDYVKRASAELAALLRGIEDKEIARKIERVYDELRTSPVKSHSSIASIESQILSGINDLRSAVSGGDKQSIFGKATHLLTLVETRNRELRLVL